MRNLTTTDKIAIIGIVCALICGMVQLIPSAGQWVGWNPFASPTNVPVFAINATPTISTMSSTIPTATSILVQITKEIKLFMSPDSVSPSIAVVGPNNVVRVKAIYGKWALVKLIYYPSINEGWVLLEELKLTNIPADIVTPTSTSQPTPK